MVDIRILLFFYFGEALLLAYVGLALFGVRLSWARLFVVGGVYSLCIWGVRSIYTIFEISFGSHTLILTAMLILIIRFIGQVDWGIAVGASLTGMTLILLGSMLTDFAAQKLNLSLDKIISSVWLNIVFGYMEDVFLILMLLLNKLLGFTFVKSFNINFD